MQTLAGELDELAGQAVGELRRQHVAEADISVQRRLHLKYQGTDTRSKCRSARWSRHARTSRLPTACAIPS